MLPFITYSIILNNNNCSNVSGINLREILTLNMSSVTFTEETGK